MEKTHGPAQEAVAAGWEQRVLALMGERRPIGVAELEAYIAEVRSSIAAGRMKLAVVQHVWGVEFYVMIGRSQSNRERLYRAH